MASYPDILVTASDSPEILVAVEVRFVNAQSDRKALEDAIYQIQHYMVKMNCPVGILVSPGELYIYRNRYTGNDERAIEEVGHYPVGDAFGQFARVSTRHTPQSKSRLFESYVQYWLEHLSDSDVLERLPADLRDALETYVLPALESGVVQAAGPRGQRNTF